MNPWDDASLHEAKLLDVDKEKERAKVYWHIPQWRDIKIPEHLLDLFYETWHYGDTAFLKWNAKEVAYEVVNWSSLSQWNGTLTEVKA